LDPDLTTNKWFDFKIDDELMDKLNEIKEIEHLLNDNLLDMGYENFNVVSNIGGMFFTLAYLMVFLILAIVFKIITSLMEFVFPYYKKKGIIVKEQLEMAE
jgi:ABC-type bacteriocin/lantibiotic exporter with double-glycine peptidase domain